MGTLVESTGDNVDRVLDDTDFVEVISESIESVAVVTDGSVALTGPILWEVIIIGWCSN
jgi:hypothetical protein